MPVSEKQFEEDVQRVLNIKYSLALRKVGKIQTGGSEYTFDFYDPNKGFYVDIYDSFRTENRSQFIDRGKTLKTFFNNQKKSCYYCLVFNNDLSAIDTNFLLENLLPNISNVKTLVLSQGDILALNVLEVNTQLENPPQKSNKTYRLGKIAGELNVGISTIAEFLAEKGIQIDVNPTTKLTADIYQLLKDQFSIDSDSKPQYLWMNFEDALPDKDNLEIGARGSINFGYVKIGNSLLSKYQGQAIIYPIEFQKTRFIYVSFTATFRSEQLLFDYVIKEVIQSELPIEAVIEQIGKAKTGVNFDVLRRVVSEFTASQFRAIIRTLKELDVESQQHNIELENEEKKSSGRNIQNNFQKTILTNDSVQSKRDLLGFENDIRAFASLIALKEMKPPLAIGLFGKWGSGKSFFMYNLQDRINHLSVHQGFENLEIENSGNEMEKPFCEGVVHVTFNAWSYMDANLWASLVATIFEELDAYISGQKLSDPEIEKVRKILNERLSFVSEEKEKVIKDRKELFVNEKKLIDKSIELQKKKHELEKQKTPKNYFKLIEKVIEELGFRNELNKLLPNLNDEKFLQLSEIELKHEIADWKSFWETIKETPYWIIIISLIGIGILVVSWIFPFSIKTLIEYIGTSITTLPGISYLLAVRIKLLRAYRKAKKYRDHIRKHLKEEKTKIIADISQIDKEIEQTNNELVLKQAKLEILESEILNLNFDLENSITKQAFFDFISSKSKDEKYQQNLSIISMIRKDFQILSELFNDYNSATENNEINKDRKSINQLLNKPLDRIVLYVDDLDRCSEERVVEVLEAVNLLMAYPLFVVVVGVDPRWVKNALMKRYSMQFTGKLENTEYKLDQIHVADYLEKIFQIPFHLYEADEDGNKRILEDILGNQIKLEEVPQSGREKYFMTRSVEIPEDIIEEFGDVKEQLNVEIQQTSPLRILPKDLKISRQELDDLQSLSWLAGNNPRTLKRYANIYRIVRVHEDLNYDEDTERDNFLVIMFLIGLSVGPYKHLANDFYAICEKELILTFSSIIEIVLKSNGVDVSGHNPFLSVPQNLDKAFGEDFCRYIDFVKRFSF